MWWINKSQLYKHPAFPFYSEEIEHMQPFDLSLRHAWNQTWYALHWNNSYGYMITNSRNTTCWLLPGIGWVSHCASKGPEGLKQSSSGHYSITGELVWSQHLTPQSVYILTGNTQPHHPRANACGFRQWTLTGFQCNLCGGWQWKHRSRISPSRETAVQQCK